MECCYVHARQTHLPLQYHNSQDSVEEKGGPHIQSPFSNILSSPAIGTNVSIFSNMQFPLLLEIILISHQNYSLIQLRSKLELLQITKMIPCSHHMLHLLESQRWLCWPMPHLHQGGWDCLPARLTTGPLPCISHIGCSHAQPGGLHLGCRGAAPCRGGEA